MPDLLFPDVLSPAVMALLVVAAALTSAVTASFGVGGGVMLLAIMAQVMPPVAVIPVHGLVQLGSNLNRTLLTLRDVNWPLLLAFTPGVVLGALAARYFLINLPTDVLLLTMALFMLYPLMPTTRLVGTEIAHAVPLTLVAGLGHAGLGNLDWNLLGTLLIGSLPGIYFGSRLSGGVPDKYLRPFLAVMLAIVGTKLVM